MLKKLALGTAQFGLNYGIANQKAPKSEIFNILRYAAKLNIGMLDTAYSYGESERIIGQFIEKENVSFDIVSKTPYFDKVDKSLTVEDLFKETLKRLKKDSLYGYLVHNFYDIASEKHTLYNEIESLKQKKLVKKIGLSLYKPEELERLLDSGISFDIVQIPYNIFDQRFHQESDCPAHKK